MEEDREEEVAKAESWSLDENQCIEEVLEGFEAFLKVRTKYHYGYPYNLSLDGADELFPFMRFSINNLGDPFVQSNYGVHSRDFEVHVLNFFSKLWKIAPEDYWGYVTTCGTEGNLHGIYVGREKLPDGILYSSVESHYSVFKACRFYRMEAVPIPTLKSGELNYDELEKALTTNKDKPAIINVNIGTTVKGAIDNVDTVIEILQRVGYSRDRWYIHCDGALFALMLPYLDAGALSATFEKHIDSISVSGHKFLGCPMPCGVILHRKHNIKEIETHIPYLSSVDTTIMGSRNGQAPLFMWLAMRKKGEAGLSEDARRCVFLAKRLAALLRDGGIGVMLNPLSNTVVLERPQDEALVQRWQLACTGNIAHAVVMPSTTGDKMQLFAECVIQCRERYPSSLCIKVHCGASCCACPSCAAESSG